MHKYIISGWVKGLENKSNADVKGKQNLKMANNKTTDLESLPDVSIFEYLNA